MIFNVFLKTNSRAILLVGSGLCRVWEFAVGDNHVSPSWCLSAALQMACILSQWPKAKLYKLWDGSRDKGWISLVFQWWNCLVSVNQQHVVREYTAVIYCFNYSRSAFRLQTMSVIRWSCNCLSLSLMKERQDTLSNWNHLQLPPTLSSIYLWLLPDQSANTQRP